MRQSRLMSLVEAVANVVAGLAVAVATQIVVFPILGVQASLAQNLKLASVFTGVSIARSYLLRRGFEALRWPIRSFDSPTIGQTSAASPAFSPVEFATSASGTQADELLA